MCKIKNIKRILPQMIVLVAFAAMAAASSSSKEFNEGFRDGYNYVRDAYSQNDGIVVDTTNVTSTHDLAINK